MMRAIFFILWLVDSGYDEAELAVLAVIFVTGIAFWAVTQAHPLDFPWEWYR